MKKLLFLISITCLFALMANGQSKSDKMYHAFEGEDGVTNFSFSKSMMDAIDIDLGDDDDERNVTGDLKEIRFLSYNPEKGRLTGQEFIQKAISLLPRSYKKYEEDGDDSDAEIWLLGSKRKYKECHLFVKNENGKGNRFIVSFYGDFKVDDIGGLKKAGREFSED